MFCYKQFFGASFYSARVLPNIKCIKRVWLWKPWVEQGIIKAFTATDLQEKGTLTATINHLKHINKYTALTSRANISMHTGIIWSVNGDSSSSAQTAMIAYNPKYTTRISAAIIHCSSYVLFE